MFNIGDLVVYGVSGVCRVEDITREPDDAEGVLCYVIKSLFQELTITTPVDTKITMRPVISKEEAEHLISKISENDVKTFNSREFKELDTHYRQFVLRNSVPDLIELTMSIYAKRRDARNAKKTLGVVDAKYKKIAESLLYGELATALNVEKAEVQSYIAERLKEM
ncbi:MAG: CarD family transcriptional regulator [Oscillospiraceae bacterium]|jgi:CarD family transcriptional regulator|nr:CarD family transcriptional regulator [Oscillospiraceae bacterium]